MTERIIRWFFRHFSYIQLYAIVCISLLLALVPIGYYWVINHFERMAYLKEQMVELHQGQLLQRLFSLVQKHRLDSVRLEEGKGASFQRDILGTQKEIEKILSTSTFLGAGQGSPSIWQYLESRSFEEKWSHLVSDLKTLNQSERIQLHTSLINELLLQFAALGQSVDIETRSEEQDPSLAQNLVVRLPQLQESVAELLILQWHPDRQKEFVLSLLEWLQTDLTSLNQVLEGDANGTSISLDKTLLAPAREYAQILEKILSQFQSAGLSLEKFVLDPESTVQLEIGFKKGEELWKKALDRLIQLVSFEYQHVKWQLWSLLMITIVLVSSGLWLGLSLLKNATRRLGDLTQATQSFAAGNFKVRLTEDYQDQIGQQVRIFNKMTDRLNQVISQLFLLVDATKELSTGNLTARLSMNESVTPEFKEVMDAFNHMAGTVGKAIDRLNEGVVLLTQSASQITVAIKEHESQVLGQERIVQEALGVSDRMATEAISFAREVEGLGQRASDATLLAQTGKGALEKMAQFMQGIVQGANDISRRLEGLQEKGETIQLIVTLIGKMADQTNLLSLNAAIEAENAGQHGKGFAIIAREVRRLADQGAAATVDVERQVSEMKRSMSEGVALVNAFRDSLNISVQQMLPVSEQLNTVIGHVESFLTPFKALEVGMRQQAQGAERIHASLQETKQMAQKSTEAVLNLQKTIIELDQGARNLESLSNLNPTFPLNSSLDLIRH